MSAENPQWPRGVRPHASTLRYGKPIETQRQELRCGACRKIFEADTPVNCVPEVMFAVLKSVCCPACRSKKVLMGSGRSVPEDRAMRTGDAYEDRVIDWAERGEVGKSSIAIFDHMLGRPNPETAAPQDVDDYVRCFLLLDRVPEWRPRIGEMATVSESWAAWAAGWEAIEIAFIDDGGLEGVMRLPKTVEAFLREISRV